MKIQTWEKSKDSIFFNEFVVKNDSLNLWLKTCNIFVIRILRYINAKMYSKRAVRSRLKLSSWLQKSLYKVQHTMQTEKTILKHISRLHGFGSWTYLLKQMWCNLAGVHMPEGHRSQIVQSGKEGNKLLSLSECIILSLPCSRTPACTATLARCCLSALDFAN